MAILSWLKKKPGNWKRAAASGGCQIPAGTDTAAPKDQLVPGAFSPEELAQIRDAVRKRYAEASGSAEGKFKYPTGREGATALGYDQEVIARMGDDLLNSFCGVGNPFGLAEIAAGSSVLDVGCGAGFDLIVARELVGPAGMVHGTDLTREMTTRAQGVVDQLSITNVAIRHVDSDALPYDDEMFDVVVSNGVINLSPSKRELFREIFRVLKPGGALQFADIVRDQDSPGGKGANLAAWAQWIGGTIPVRDQVQLLEEAGFTDIEYKGGSGFKTSPQTISALFIARKS